MVDGQHQGKDVIRILGQLFATFEQSASYENLLEIPNSSHQGTIIRYNVTSYKKKTTQWNSLFTLLSSFTTYICCLLLLLDLHYRIQHLGCVDIVAKSALPVLEKNTLVPGTQNVDSAQQCAVTFQIPGGAGRLGAA